MSNSPKKANRRRDRRKPTELEAVKTTIVGGRPPGSGRVWGEIPRGIEVLVKKASIDPEFRELLLEQRAAVAHEIALELDPAEVMILDNVPREQLEAIIDRTEVDVQSRSAFLGRAAAVMLAALGAGPLVATEMGDSPKSDESGGEQAKSSGKKRRPSARETAPTKLERPQYEPPSDGIRPTPTPTPTPTRGVQPTPTPTPKPTPTPTPTPPPSSTGIRPTPTPEPTPTPIRTPRVRGITPERPSRVKRWRRYK